MILLLNLFKYWNRKSLKVYVNVAFNRQVNVLPKLYNCGSFYRFYG